MGSVVVSGGFATAVALAVVGYLTCLPVYRCPPVVTFVLLLVCVVGGGFMVGRFMGASFGQGLGATAVNVLVNMIVLGSLIAEPGGNGELAVDVPPVWAWLPGYLAATFALFVGGALAGRWMRPTGAGWVRPRLLLAIATVASTALTILTGGLLAGRWMRPAGAGWVRPGLLLAIAAVASTALTIFAGGLVTGFDAGFAVTGWPDTFGANMFFYPYSKMTGGIYYEHAHRLLGATTGVTAVALAAHMLWLDRRRLMRWAVVAAVILVCLQGLLGALWVIDKTLVYYLVHGTLAQLLLGCFVAITAGEMRTWREADLSAATPTAAADRRLAVGLVAALIVQLILGVVVRRTGQLVILHIANASLVVMAAVAVGMRCVAGPGAAHAALKRTGMMILGVTVVQVILGVVSLAFRETEGTKTVVVGSSKVGSASDAVWTTLHQSVGALLLAIAVLAMVLVYRLLRPEALTQTPVAAAGTELDVA